MITEQSVHVNDINRDRQPYRITTESSVERLAESVAQAGVLNPCILLKGAEGFVVVSGHRRVEACMHAGLTNVPGLVVDTADDEAGALLYCAKAAVADNAFSRTLNMVEKAKALVLLQRHMSLDQIVTNSAAVFNEPLSGKIVQKLITVGGQTGEVHRLILDSRLSVNTVEKLQGFDPVIREKFIKLFQGIKMNQNKQLEVVTFLQEIAAREKISLADLFDTEKIDSIISMDNPDENLKAARLRAYLAERRFPELSRAYRNHKSAVKDLGIHPHIRLDPPLDFEGDTYRISFDFKSVEEFHRALDSLIRIRYSERLRDVII